MINPAAIEALRELESPEDPNLVNELIELFARTSATLLTEIEVAISDRNAGKLNTAAHTLKSSAANLGATRVAEKAAVIEAIGNRGTTAESEPHFVTLKNELSIAVLELQEIRNGKSR